HGVRPGAGAAPAPLRGRAEVDGLGRLAPALLGGRPEGPRRRRPLLAGRHRHARPAPAVPRRVRQRALDGAGHRDRQPVADGDAAGRCGQRRRALRAVLREAARSLRPVTAVRRAEPHDAETVASLLIAFRDHYGRDRPSDNAMLAVVERLIEQPDVDFLLASVDDDSPPAGVCQLRYRLSVWTAAPDCWLEDLFVAEHARRTGLGATLVEAAL